MSDRNHVNRCANCKHLQKFYFNIIPICDLGGHRIQCDKPEWTKCKKHEPKVRVNKNENKK